MSRRTSAGRSEGSRSCRWRRITRAIVVAAPGLAGQPDAADAGAVGAGNVRVQLVADEQHVVRRAAAARQRVGEEAGRWLAGAGVDRGDHPREDAAEAGPHQPGADVALVAFTRVRPHRQRQRDRTQRLADAGHQVRRGDRRAGRDGPGARPSGCGPDRGPAPSPRSRAPQPLAPRRGMATPSCGALLVLFLGRWLPARIFLRRRMLFGVTSTSSSSSMNSIACLERELPRRIRRMASRRRSTRACWSASSPS